MNAWRNTEPGARRSLILLLSWLDPTNDSDKAAIGFLLPAVWDYVARCQRQSDALACRIRADRERVANWNPNYWRVAESVKIAADARLMYDLACELWRRTL